MANFSRAALARDFRRFAREEVRDASPLYEKLSLALAKDRQLLALAAYARKGERAPNLFFAAVQFLLLNGIKHPVAAFYRTVSDAASSGGNPYPQFRSFCLEYQEEIRGLISVGFVQTNEVRRCAFLAPAFVFVSRLAQRRPLYLIEIGASAGLNLLWDRYGYRYGESRAGGNLNSPVQITCALKGDGQPPMSENFPPVAARIGLERVPIDVRDPDAISWLRALIWPEQVERTELLERAIRVARQNPVKLIAGDATETLPAVLEEVSKDAAPCVFRTFTALPVQSRERLAAVCDHYGSRRDLFLLFTRGPGSIESELRLVSFIDGVKTEKILARCHNHGQWLEWLED